MGGDRRRGPGRRRSSSTWSRSWTRRRRSPPARWPSAGSGTSFVGWGLFCGAIYYPLFGAWTWGGGWLAKLGNSAQLGFGYVDFAGSGVVHAMGGVAGARRCAGPRRSHRQVRHGRQAPHAGGAQHPDGDARHVHPAVRLVRVQRRVDVRGDRRPVRGSSRRTPRSRRRSVRSSRCCTCRCATGKPDPGMMATACSPASSRSRRRARSSQPWAAAVIGIIAGVLVVESVLVLRAARHRRPGGRDLGATASADLSGVLSHRHLRRRHVRRRLERHDQGCRGNRERRHGLPVRQRARLPPAGLAGDRCLVICTVIFGHRVRLLQDPERAS